MKRAYEKVARTWERGRRREGTAIERKKDEHKKTEMKERNESQAECAALPTCRLPKGSSASASAKLVLQRFPISMLKAQRGRVS